MKHERHLIHCNSAIYTQHTHYDGFNIDSPNVGWPTIVVIMNIYSSKVLGFWFPSTTMD